MVSKIFKERVNEYSFVWLKTLGTLVGLYLSISVKKNFTSNFNLSSNFVCHNWEFTLIYRPLSYPLRSLIFIEQGQLCTYAKLVLKLSASKLSTNNSEVQGDINFPTIVLSLYIPELAAASLASNSRFISMRFKYH